MVYGKGGIYGTKSKRRIVPLTDRVRPLIDNHFALYDTIGMTPRTIQRILKRLANKARINRPVSPHVLSHTFAVAAVQKGISDQRAQAPADPWWRQEGERGGQIGQYVSEKPCLQPRVSDNPQTDDCRLVCDVTEVTRMWTTRAERTHAFPPLGMTVRGPRASAEALLRQLWGTPTWVA